MLFKRDTNVKVAAYIETVIVTDVSVYNGFASYLNTTDQNIIFRNMLIYFAFILNGVNKK